MLLYLDTSALLPLVIQEPGTPVCQRVWRAATDVVSSALIEVEAMAALAQARRMDRLTASGFRRARSATATLLRHITTLAVTHEVISSAAELAHGHRLRAYDAVHLASSLAIRSDDVVAATGDRALLAAWTAEGFVTVDPFAAASS